MISGKTRLIAHVGYPTESFKAPMIYNPWFEKQGIDAVVVPMGVSGEDFAAAWRRCASFTNLHGALITMPHKVAVVGMLDEASTAVKIAGSCNALRLRADGSLLGDMFDGAGFVRGPEAQGTARWPARRASSSAPVASARRSRPRSPPRGRRRSRCSTPTPPRRPASRHGSASTIRRSTSASARTTPPATRWWSTARRSA